MKIALISTLTYPSDQGLRYISSYLRDKLKHKTIMIFLPIEENYNLNYSEKTLAQLRDLVKDCDLIGISAFGSTRFRAQQVLSFLKKEVPKIPLIWGGVHATLWPEECIEYADMVCMGEGEEAIGELVTKLEKHQNYLDTKNFVFKKDGKIIKNELRNLTHDLDSLPPADYDIENHYIIDSSNSIVKFKEKDFGGQIFNMTVRGCPNACTYCINYAWRSKYIGKGKLIRRHSVDYVIKDLARLKNKYRSIGTIDMRAETLFVMPIEEIREFCDKYKKQINLRFKCLSDPPTMDYEKLKLFVDAGLTDIIIGIQAGTDRINYEIYKRFISTKQVLKAAEIVNKFKGKVAVMYDMITCNPYETEQDLVDTIKLMKKLPPPFFLSINNLVFFPGTELEKRARLDGIIKTDKDTAADLNYWDRWKHIKLKKKNEYLILIINLMRGVATKHRFGVMPRFLLNILTTKSLIKLNQKYKLPTYIAGNIVQGFDFLRENLAKKIYRKILPPSFKNWYDKIRYRI